MAIQLPGFERRSLSYKVSLRTESNGTVFAEGYAAKFNKKSQDLGGFREILAPTAFNRAITEKQDVRMLLNHNPDAIFGRTKSGTLALTTDSIGLRFRCALPETQAAHDLAESMNRGDINQCSFSFSVIQPGGDSWDEEKDGEDNAILLRTVRDLNLFDVSCVTYPAYEDTACQVAERTLVEARSHARTHGKILVVTKGVARYQRMTDAEIAAAAEMERGIKGMTLGETPYGWQR